MHQHGRTKTFQIVTLSLLVALLAGLWLGRQQFTDWVKLYNYTPPQSISSVADTTTMTDFGKKLFYVNHPVIDTDRAQFSQACPVDMEKTIVLGCYKAVDRGIFLYNPNDPRLQGVIETTAAHEMLHAGYERLSSKERARIDSLLLTFYTTQLKDERIKKTIDAYKAANAPIENEMHSIFGTEVAQLTPELEAYYRKYFTNRAAVVSQLERYQVEFSRREAQIATYDTQLASQKKEIASLQSQIKAQGSQISDMEEQMNQYRSDGDYETYNQMVPAYNARIGSYNTAIDALKDKISTFNNLVDKRNALALEESELVKALSGTSQAERDSL